MSDRSRSASFPVGYRSFHADPSINFELNRWLSALPEDELRAAAPRIVTLADWKTVMLELAERAERDAERRGRCGQRRSPAPAPRPSTTAPASSSSTLAIPTRTAPIAASSSSSTVR